MFASAIILNFNHLILLGREHRNLDLAQGCNCCSIQHFSPSTSLPPGTQNIHNQNIRSCSVRCSPFSPSDRNCCRRWRRFLLPHKDWKYTLDSLKVPGLLIFWRGGLAGHLASFLVLGSNNVPVVILFPLSKQLYHLPPLRYLPLHCLKIICKNVHLSKLPRIKYPLLTLSTLKSLTLIYCSILLVPSSNSWTNSSPQCLSFSLSWKKIYLNHLLQLF